MNPRGNQLDRPTEEHKLDAVQQQTLHRLFTDFAFFAKCCLYVVDEEGKQVPFILNAPQLYLLQAVERQLKERGRARIIIVKGRQQGISTFVEAYGFWLALTSQHKKKIFILAHQAKSTTSLFSMVKNFIKQLPDAIKQLAPTETANRTELTFAGNSSEYALGTAGSDEVGRGMTIQYLHGSEVALWPNPEQLATGLLRAVNNVNGTYVFLESTANGMGNYFHRMALAGLKPGATYETVFIPWFWTPKYRQEPPPDFSYTRDEQRIASQYGLDPDQMYWRRRVIEDECGGKVWQFNQEYPTCFNDAFVASGDSYFNAELVETARLNHPENRIRNISAPRILGLDPARTGDRSSLCQRKGRDVEWFRTIPQPVDSYVIAAAVVAAVEAAAAQKDPIKKIFIDCSNAYGDAVYDILLHDYQYQGLVTRVQFQGTAIEPERFANKRAEMIVLAEEWFQEGGTSFPKEATGFQAELMAHPVPKKSSARGKLLFAPKEEIKAEIGGSPDEADSFFLTFAYPVYSEAAQEVLDRRVMANTKREASKTLERFRSRQK